MTNKKSNKTSNKGQYDNPKGHITDDELKQLKEKDYEELYKWLQGFKITQNKCPPEKKCLCISFQCERCYARAIGKDFYDYVYKDFDREMDKSKEKNKED